MAITITVPAAATISGTAYAPTGYAWTKVSPIQSTYETGPFGGEVGRSLFSWFLARIGSADGIHDGEFHWYVKRPDGTTIQQQDGIVYGDALHEFESPIKHTGNQQDIYMSVGIQTGTESDDNAFSTFTMNRLGVSFKPAPNAPIKGHN